MKKRPRAKYLSNEQIWSQVEEFRESDAVIEYVDLPIDTFNVADLGLHFDIVPLPEMQELLGQPSAIVCSKRILYIDSQAFEKAERDAEWIPPFLRFSMAHEIGHYIMHSQHWDQLGIETLDQYIGWFGHATNRMKDSLEYQADEFAGRFLVPVDKLIEEYDACVNSAPSIHDLEDPADVIAEKIKGRFGVSASVIRKRIERENI
jgi:hypothetical protein